MCRRSFLPGPRATASAPVATAAGDESETPTTRAADPSAAAGPSLLAKKPGAAMSLRAARRGKFVASAEL